MKIFVEQRAFKNFDGGNRSKFNAVKEEFCCDTAEEAYREGFLGFGEMPGELSIIAVNPHIAIYQTETSDCGDDAVVDYEHITFCPFCGTRISFEIEKILEKDLIEEEKRNAQKVIDYLERDIENKNKQLADKKKRLEGLTNDI